MKRFRRLAPLALLLTLGAVNTTGCADVGSSSDFASDSFASPTEHGDLRFDVANPAEFTDAQRFHSWTFELTDTAEVDIRTQLSTTNLDSVMYLYKEGESGWGSYIQKNDDDGDSLASRVGGSLEAGRYRIKVKAAKTALRGSFSLFGTCSGAGCPTLGGSCLPADAPMDEATGYTQSCAAKVHAILTTPVKPGGACSSELEERAVAYYKQYWDYVYSWEDISYGEEPSVGSYDHDGVGTVVTVDLGGDEDAMDYVFDADGNLIVNYQHNQSPDWEWYCGVEGESAADEPDESCISDFLGHHDYSLADITPSEGTITPSTASTLSPHIAAAVAEYAAAEGLGPDATIVYEASSWAAYYNDGVDVAFESAGAVSASYIVVGDPQYGMTVQMRKDATGVKFLCKEL